MNNPFENYPTEWMTDPNIPIVFAVTAEQMSQFMDDQDYEPLTHEEWSELPDAFSDTDGYAFLDEALSVLRPNHRDRIADA